MPQSSLGTVQDRLRLFPIKIKVLPFPDIVENQQPDFVSKLSQ